MKSPVSIFAILAIVSATLLISCSKDNDSPKPVPDEDISFMVISDLHYMKTAAEKAWDAAGSILQSLLDFKDKDDLQAFLSQRFEQVFYTFLTRTSDGNEHLHSPQENYESAEAALKGLFDFFKSAYYNYLGDDCVMPDDAVEIQLHK